MRLGGIESLVVLLAGAAMLSRRAPLAAAIAFAAVAGCLWGASATHTLATSCAGRWSAARGARVAALVTLGDPVGPDGGIADVAVRHGSCRGSFRARWPSRHDAHGGTTWVVAGTWIGDARTGLLAVRRVRVLDRSGSGRGHWRDLVTQRTARLFGARAPLVDALLINRRADLDPEIRERYARSGLTHLLSISGLHVGFLAAWITLLLRRLPLRPPLQTCIALTLVFAYIWLLGMPAAALRAALMLLIAELARVRQRVVAPRGSIALAALLVMVIDPWAVTSVGAWLSVSAIAAVIWADRRFRTAPRVIRLLAPSIAATLLTAPITAFSFGTVAPVGVVANLVAIPLGALAVPGVALALAASFAWPAAAGLLAAGSGLCLALLDVIAALAARVPLGHVITEAGWGAGATWLAVGAAVWWLWHAPRHGAVRAARLALLAAAASWTLVATGIPRDRDGALTVHFLDVGQGDAAVLRTPQGHFVVIDAGPRGPAGDAGRRVVVPFLRREGARRIDVVVASHGHADHVGGMPALMAALPVDLVLDPAEPVPDPVYLEYLAAVDGASVPWRRARAGDTMVVDGVRLVVLSPDSVWAEQTLDPNEESIVLLVEYAGCRLVFMGDAGEPVERRLANRVGDIDLLKVGHHGSRTASTTAWLAELQPETAVISVARRNRYGHPAPQTLERLAAAGARVLRTDQSGTLTWRTDQICAHSDVGHHD
jgi:competence protein ComEC